MTSTIKTAAKVVEKVNQSNGKKWHKKRKTHKSKIKKKQSSAWLVYCKHRQRAYLWWRNIPMGVKGRTESRHWKRNNSSTGSCNKNITNGNRQQMRTVPTNWWGSRPHYNSMTYTGKIIDHEGTWYINVLYNNLKVTEVLFSITNKKKKRKRNSLPSLDTAKSVMHILHSWLYPEI